MTNALDPPFARAPRLRRELPLLALAAACSADEPRDVTVRVYGEAFVEDEIPRSEVADGWTIRFDEFVVAIHDVQVVADETVELPGTHVVDLTSPSGGDGHGLGTLSIVGAPIRVDYRIGRAIGSDGGNASAEQVERMRSGGLGLWVSGHAEREGEAIGFQWGLPIESGHTCALGQEIATPRADGPVLTIHADHLLLDDLEHDPRIAFDLVAAADADGDGVVRSDELSGVDLRTLDRYQSGSLEIPDLWNYVGALAGTLAHVDGEGGCLPQFVPGPYRGAAADVEARAAAELFATHCASCHGDAGAGDGPAADAARPRASDLTRLRSGADAPDYLAFRITEGGAFFPYNSTMPAFADVLSAADIERLVGHVLSLTR